LFFTLRLRRLADGGRKSFTVARYDSIFTLRQLADEKIKSYENLKPNHIKLLVEGA
jgi:hypothetical protein